MLVASRRHRRGPWLLLAVLVTVVVLAVNAALSARSPGQSRTLAQLAYLDPLPPAVRAKSTMPVSLWVPDAQMWMEGDVAGFITTLRSSATLAPVHDLSLLVVATDPAPIGTDGRTAVLPAVASISVRLV